MNLAGHPFALLTSAQGESAAHPIYDEWPRLLPGGQRVTASWRVEPGAHLGLPGPNEEVLYLLLLQLTREAAESAGTPNEWPQVVPFSRGDLLERMGWHCGARGAGTLKQAFARLTAVSVTACWAFWDARAKSPVEQVGFHIIAGYSLMAEPRGRKTEGALPLSWFKWDDVVFASLLAGNVRSLALDFTLSLQLPTSRRLFRLLEVLRHAEKTPRQELCIGLFKLRNRLGMTPYKQPSKVKEKLLAGIEELQGAGYLAGVEWDKARDGSPLALFRFGKAGTPQLPTQAVETPLRGRMAPKTASLPVAGAAPVESPQQLARRMSEFGSEKVEMAQMTTQAVETPLRGRMAPKTASPPVAGAAPSESPQQFARRMSEIYAAMPEPERLRLRDEARTTVAQEFWDRLEVPSSPISLELWKLVEQETR